MNHQSCDFCKRPTKELLDLHFLGKKYELCRVCDITFRRVRLEGSNEALRTKLEEAK